MTVCVFPGQGSQKPGMWSHVFDHYSDHVEYVDKVLGYSIKQLCSKDTFSQLTATQYTQPAIYAVSALSYLDYLRNHQPPTFVMGHSLGEYSALFAGGVFSFETGLKLVQKRGELMSKISEGGMAAVVGLDINSVQQVLEVNDIETIDIANHNSYEQVVLAGPNKQILAAQSIFEKAGATMYVPLGVSGAFHSRYMQGAMEEFTAYVNQITFNAPKISVISNVTAKPHTLDEVKQSIAKQMVNCVRWVDCVEYVAAYGESSFNEVGPGQVLTGLTNSILH